MTRSSLPIATLTLGLSLSLAACGSGGGDASSSSGTDGAWSGQTLTVWIMEGTNPDAEPFFDEVATAFEEETGATLDVQFQPWASAHDKFTTAIAGGTTPDVAEIGTTWTPEFAEVGALADLTDLVADAGLDDDLVPGLQEAGTVDGALYGMPWYAGVRSFVYRTDLFEQAGVEVPTTWDELRQAALTLKETFPDTTAWPIAGDSQYGVMPFVWGAGGQIAEQDGDTWTSGIDSDAAREGIEFYTDMALEDGVSTAAATTWKETDLLKAFEQGDAAMMITGSWTPKTILADAPDLEGKIGAFPIPGQDEGVSPSFLGGSHLGIFNESDKQDLAWEFVQMMSTGEFAQRWADEANYFPGQASLLEAAAESDDPLVAPFAQQMVDGGASLPVTPLYGQIQGKKTVETMLQSILSGKESVDQATSTAADDMNATFAG